MVYGLNLQEKERKNKHTINLVTTPYIPHISHEYTTITVTIES